MSEAKKYYQKDYHPQFNLSGANIRLYSAILDQHGIDTVFEFGCNIGRHLSRLKEWGYQVSGMDINPQFIQFARELGINAHVGSETDLYAIADNSFDLVFTNSVLCHMNPESYKVAMKEIKRIAKTKIIIMECVTKEHDYWWIHDYKAEGFKVLGRYPSHTVKDAEYHLMICEL